MFFMNKKVLYTLEYHKVIDMLCDRVYDAVMTVADLRDLP